jgi:hypothetical protein
MPNIIREHKIIDNQKRALIKYVFLYVDTAQANTVLVDVSNLGYALNANGKIMSSNVHPKPTYRTKVKRIFGTAKSSGYVKLQWHGDSNSEIVTFNTGSFDYNFESMGDVATIGNPEANSTGDILLTTSGAASGDVFTLFVDLRKDNQDYDSGQSADPVAFNQGPALFT